MGVWSTSSTRVTDCHPSSESQPCRSTATARSARVRRPARRLGDAVADEVDRVEPRHVLQLQKIDRVALTLREQRHQHVRAGYLVTTGRLHVDRGTLHDSLEAGGWLRIAGPVGCQAGKVLVEKLRQIVAQLVEIDATGAQYRCRVRIIRQAQKQVLQRRIFVMTLAGERQCAVQRLFEVS